VALDRGAFLFLCEQFRLARCDITTSADNTGARRARHDGGRYRIANHNTARLGCCTSPFLARLPFLTGLLFQLVRGSAGL